MFQTGKNRIRRQLTRHDSGEKGEDNTDVKHVEFVCRKIKRDIE
jgi:hypothetical protein